MGSEIEINCPHCGVLIKLDSSLAGAVGACPSCKGAMTVPHLPASSQFTIPPPQLNQKQAGSGFFKVVLIVICVVVVLFYKVQKRKAELEEAKAQANRVLRESRMLSYNRAGRFGLNLQNPTPSADGSSTLVSEPKYTEFDFQGLKMVLPGKPKLDSMDIPPELKKLISNVEMRKIDLPDYKISLSFIEYRTMQGGLHDAAKGAIASVRSESGVSSFEAKETNVVVDNLGARRI